MRRYAATALALALLPACVTMRAAPPPRTVPARIVLLPVYDPPERSAVSGIFTFYSWIAETRAGVPALLANALRTELARRGITLADGIDATAPPDLDAARALAGRTALDAPALFIAIGKWEADQAQFPEYVDVALAATLFDPSSGRTLWTAGREAGPVATLGSTSLVAAYQRAAAQVAADLVGHWPTPTPA
jgi:hypothetical protein